MFLKDTYGLTGVVTKMEILETDPLYLIEGPSSELWASLKDIRRFGEYSGSKGS